MSDLYQEIILEEFKNPQNYGVMKDADLVLRERNSSCGDEVTIYLKLDEQGNISAIKWQGQGCAIRMAAMSVLSAQIKNQKLSARQIRAFTQEQLEEMLGLDEISVGRVKCLLLGAKAFSQIPQSNQSK